MIYSNNIYAQLSDSEIFHKYVFAIEIFYSFYQYSNIKTTRLMKCGKTNSQ